MDAAITRVRTLLVGIRVVSKVLLCSGRGRANDPFEYERSENL